MSEDPESRGHFDPLEAIGTVPTKEGRIDVSLAVWVDTSGKAEKRGEPMLRVVRVTERKDSGRARALTSYKSAEEAEAVGTLIVKAAGVWRKMGRGK